MRSSRPVRWSPVGFIETTINLWFDTSDNNRAITGFLVLFVAVWTSFQVLSYMSIGLHKDMVEAFSWSQQLAPGYKHPPLTAMIVAAWFSVFPITD